MYRHRDLSGPRRCPNAHDIVCLLILGPQRIIVVLTCVVEAQSCDRIHIWPMWMPSSGATKNSWRYNMKSARGGGALHPHLNLCVFEYNSLPYMQRQQPICDVVDWFSVAFSTVDLWIVIRRLSAIVRFGTISQNVIRNQIFKIIKILETFINSPIIKNIIKHVIYSYASTTRLDNTFRINV